jgi:Fe-S-cluster-containing hydrogenase component 2
VRKFFKTGLKSSARTLKEDWELEFRTFGEGKAGVIGSQAAISDGACLHCKDSPCVYFHESQITTPVLLQFPFNRSNEVCPVGALSVDSSKQIPIVSDSLCIGCGLCVSRCPANAIFIDNRGSAVLNDGDSDAFNTAEVYNEASHSLTIRELEKAPKNGTIRHLSYRSVDNVLSRVAALKLSNTNQKLLARNLLICLGTEAAISSVGDTNLRIDMWWANSGILYVTEVDFDLVSLVDSPRNLLDDIAVCVSRHGVSRESICAAVINIEFPNKRSDYYHLIEDIQKVAGATIITLPVAALLLALWGHKKIDCINLSECVAIKNSEGSAACVKGFVSDQLLLNSRYLRATK